VIKTSITKTIHGPTLWQPKKLDRLSRIKTCKNDLAFDLKLYVKEKTWDSGEGK